MNKYLFSGIAIITVIGALIYSRKTTDVKTVNQEATSTVTPTPQTQTAGENATITPMQNDADKLVIEDLEVGTGEEAVAGKKITVNYKGTLTNGTKFDSSYDRGVPFSFVLGSGYVIQGWDQGFAGMKVGGKRKLTIPPSLGYGTQATGAIPPNSVLIFEVELLKVE